MNSGRREVLFRAPEIFSKVVGIHRFNVEVHGIPLCFHSSNAFLINQLAEYFPKSWQKSHQDAFHIYWKDPNNFFEQPVNNWDDIEDPGCTFMNEWVSQRDFVAQRLPHRQINLVAKEEISDGLFNFLRYLLPYELLKQNKILFHSSCVVDKNDEAYLFFGHSGAGKSTISQLCTKANVLGDDMNLLTVHPNVIFVEAGAVGQRFYSKENFGTKYVVENAFWLKKSKKIQASPLQEKKVSLLLSSFTGLFWDQLSEEDYLKVFQLANTLNRNLGLYNLEFSLDKKVWNYVRKFKKSI